MVIDVDLTAVHQVRNAADSQHQTKPSYTAFLVKAIALTLCEQTHVNRIAVEWPFYKRLVQLHDSDVSVAVEKDTAEFNQAVYVASVRQADRKSLAEITEELRTFV